MRPIPKHTGYFANDKGEIISTRRGSPRKLTGYVNGDGYLTVTITADDGIKRKTLVHRLILLAYKIESAFDEAVGRHMNGKPLDNRPDNLEWGTQHDNFMDAVKHGTRANGKDLCRKITLPEVVRKVRSDSENGISDEIIADRYAMSQIQVYRIRTKRRWANVV